MIALRMTDLKSFTTSLFLHTTFDAFEICEASFAVAATYFVDGHRNKDFYDTDEWEGLKHREYLTWGEVRPRCFEWIKGSKLPLGFKIVLRSPNTEDGTAFLNIRYDQAGMQCITGFSAKTFSLDRAAERDWDDRIRRFFQKQGMSFEEV